MPVKTQELVTLACSRCERPITGDDAPAVDALTNLPVCDGCVRAQRHARRAKAGA